MQVLVSTGSGVWSFCFGSIALLSAAEDAEAWPIFAAPLQLGESECV